MLICLTSDVASAIGEFLNLFFGEDAEDDDSSSNDDGVAAEV